MQPVARAWKRSRCWPPPDLARLPAALVRLLEYADSCERKDMGEPDQRVALEGRDGAPIVFTVNLDRAGADDGD
jgi:hypothetical protein